MNYNILLDMVTDLGYRLAMCGAETFRVEESINRILSAYNISSEVFAIPNCLTVSIQTADGKPMTRMRRIGPHGSDMDSVERYSSLGRRICSQIPSPEEAAEWLKQTDTTLKHYSLPVVLLGHFLGAAGFAVFFGGNHIDFICAGVCGLIVALISRFMESLKTNDFFRIITAAFVMALAAYGMGAAGMTNNTDAVVIGTLMILVPGLLFTNAMRDIIFGDTNSGMNRIIQVLLTAAAIALGTGAAWNLATHLMGAPAAQSVSDLPYLIQALGCYIGCVGFFIYFNIHGPGGFLCALGGLLSWAAYFVVVQLGFGEIMGYFIAAIVAAIYSEMLARIRKCPAISYLVIAIFPLIPGAGIYYTTNYLARGDMEMFTYQGGKTIAIAGVIAVGILLVSTTVRLINVWKQNKKA